MPTFADWIGRLQRFKWLQHFQIFDARYLITLDGSRFFSSELVNCEHCLTTTKAGVTRYHHDILQAAIVRPGKPEVLPLAPEFIRNSDGKGGKYDKQDCEINAGYRMLERLRGDYPRMAAIIVAPGSPGWLPTPGPHSPVRARLTHTVPQVTASLRRRNTPSRIRCPSIVRFSFSAIRCCFVNTFQIPLHLPCFPAAVLQLDALLPSTGSGAATVPPLHQYYGGAKTSRCPCRRASLPSLGDTMSASDCSFLCFLGCPSTQAWTLLCGRPSGSPVMESTRPPRFLGHPLHICPALGPRSGRRAKPFRHAGAVPALSTTKTPTRNNLSRLNHTASAVAVYASPTGSPPTSARLASGCRLRSTGWDWLPTGWLRKVSDALHLPPFPGLAWRDDSLYSKQPFVEQLTAKRFSFLLVAQPGDHKSLYQDVAGLRRRNLLDRHHTEHRGVRHEYEWVTGLPLNGKPDAPLINFILFRIVEGGKATRTNVWVTDLVPTIDNIAQLVRAARARWKIENETFNTLKNRATTWSTISATATSTCQRRSLRSICSPFSYTRSSNWSMACIRGCAPSSVPAARSGTRCAPPSGCFCLPRGTRYWSA